MVTIPVEEHSYTDVPFIGIDYDTDSADLVPQLFTFLFPFVTGSSYKLINVPFIDLNKIFLRPSWVIV